MARPSDNSLKYYNRDTKDDDNLLYVEAVHGLVGYAIVDKLWKHMYGCPGGYYCEFGEINQRLFCKNNGLSIEGLWKILDTCFESGIEIFSRQMYEQYRILTSTGVQKRWLRIVKEAGRKNSSIKEEYRLIEIEVQEKSPAQELKPGSPPDNSPGNYTAAVVSHPVTTPETPQSKVKESKIKESKKEEGAPAAPTPDPKVARKKSRVNFVPPTQEEVQQFFLKKIGQRWGDAKAKREADEFLDHYTANGWVQGKGKPIVDWQAACRNWIRRELSGDFSNGAPPAQQQSRPVVAPRAPEPPPRPIEAQLTEQEKELRTQEFVNDLYADFLAGTLRFEFITTNVYDFLKKDGLMKMQQSTTDQIRAQAMEKRIVELRASSQPDDAKILAVLTETPDSDEAKNEKGFIRMAKRLALLEFFGQLKGKQETEVYHLKANEHGPQQPV